MKVLFVCTGNVFRSMSAEKCFNDFVTRNKIEGFIADSAGTDPRDQDVRPQVSGRLNFHGIQVTHHYKKLTMDMINSNDVIIAMSTDHKEFIKNTFGVDVPLFNEIAFGKSEGVLDFHDVYGRDVYSTGPTDLLQLHANKIVDYIYDAMPSLFANLSKNNHLS